VARFAVAAFRADVARAGAVRNVQALVDELCRLSPEFQTIWRDNDVRSTYGELAKTLRHPLAGNDRAGIFGLCRRRPSRISAWSSTTRPRRPTPTGSDRWSSGPHWRRHDDRRPITFYFYALSLRVLAGALPFLPFNLL